MFTDEEAIQKLSSIKDSGTNKSVVDLGWISTVNIRGAKAIVKLNIPRYAQTQTQQIAQDIKDLLGCEEQIAEVQIELSNSSDKGEIGNAGHGQVASLQRVPGVKNVIAVTSGKGGVGKSTVAVNLACSLAQTGYSVGLLDADIYGPNTPIMLGVSDMTPEVIGSGAEQKIVPIETCGIAMVSMGLLIDEDQPVIWRGPMLNGIIRQFLYQAIWGDRDFLIVDLPPGTGDAQLSLAQAVPMSGALIVTTPQTVSLQDSRRGLSMFKQMNVPILGVIENMSVFVTPDQPQRSYELFGSGAGQTLAMENSVPLLAQLPLELNPLDTQNEGLPIIIQNPESITAKAFEKLVGSIEDKLQLKKR